MCNFARRMLAWHDLSRQFSLPLFGSFRRRVEISTRKANVSDEICASKTSFSNLWRVGMVDGGRGCDFYVCV